MTGVRALIIVSSATSLCVFALCIFLFGQLSLKYCLTAGKIVVNKTIQVWVPG